MRTQISLIAFAALNCALVQASEIKLGQLAPDVAVTNCGNAAVHLSEYRQKKDVVVLSQASGNPLAPDVREDACRRLEPLSVVVLFSPGEAGAGRRLLGPAESGTLLIDSTGVMRRLEAGHVLTGSQLVQFVENWRDGKSVYNAACARCHGEDGALDICQDVKPLTGIGNRLTPGQIREKLRIGELDERHVLIRGQFLKREDVDAVIAYISGL